jgi:lysophospholipase L1-like esterase
VRSPALVSAALLLVTGLLAGCADAGAASAGVAGTVRVVAVGDSITQADSADFDDGDIGAGSWAAYAGGEGVVVLGGWAHGGATTEDMREGVADDDSFPRADVLVLMAGNNDVDAAVPFEVAADNLVAVAAAVHAGRVVLSAIAPEDGVADAVAAFNARLPELAAQQGWQLVDPMAGVGDGHGHYLPGTSEDGVHPTAPGARRIGAALHPALIG